MHPAHQSCQPSSQVHDWSFERQPGTQGNSYRRQKQPASARKVRFSAIGVCQVESGIIGPSVDMLGARWALAFCKRLCLRQRTVRASVDVEFLELGRLDGHRITVRQVFDIE